MDDSMSAIVWSPAYVGIGSNLNDPAARVREAWGCLQQLAVTRAVCLSPLYSNPPMGPQDQPDYVNAVAGLLTQLEPQALLEALQGVEQRMGRQRTPGDRWGPRIIDLDLLLYSSHELSTARLTLPHPGISERNFVLFPLCDIAPDLQVPGQGRVRTLAGRMEATGLQRVAS